MGIYFSENLASHNSSVRHHFLHLNTGVFLGTIIGIFIISPPPFPFQKLQIHICLCQSQKCPILPNQNTAFSREISFQSLLFNSQRCVPEETLHVRVLHISKDCLRNHTESFCLQTERHIFKSSVAVPSLQVF